MSAGGSTESAVRAERPHAKRAGCYSAREIRELVGSRAVAQSAALRAGFDAFLARDERLRSQLAGNHPKRRKLLGSAEDLPYTLYEDLIGIAPEDASTVPVSEAVVWHESADPAERAAILSEAKTVLLLVRFLARLAIATRLRHPAILLLLWRLLAEFSAETADRNRAELMPPARLARPPSRIVIAGPRVARAPGHGTSLAAHSREDRAGPCAPKGSASPA